jgi:glycerophosphoryl diester phosphodiesterase
MKVIDKLLSHRLRGFGVPENTDAAIEAACAAGIRYLEIDTRVDEDGVIYVRHDPWAGARRSLSGRPPANRTRDNLPPSLRGRLFRLEQALRLFSNCSQPSQKLCIDIKDYGFEDVHLELVRQAGLEERVYFVSWIPQTILRLRALGAKSPLVLSYCDIGRLGWLGRIVEGVLANQCRRCGRFVILGRNRGVDQLGPLAQGFQHGLFCIGLPLPLVEALRDSRGGICVQRQLVDRTLIKRCTGQDLQLWTFSVATTAEFLQYAQQPGVDVVFCDQAKSVAKALGERSVSRNERE